MEDKDIQEEVTSKLPVQGSGSILAAERKKQKRSVEEIADELNLSVTQVRTIELDQTDGLPEPTYVRGYIRSYSKLLGLDPVEVLKNYLNPNWQKTSKLDDLPRGIGNTQEHGSNRSFKLGRFILLLLIAAGVAFLWYSGILDSFINKDSEPQIVSTSPASSNVNEVADNDVTGQSSNNNLAASNGAAIATGELTDPALSTESSAAELVLNFTQTSWVDIRAEDESRLAYKSYVAGEELIVSSDASMSVFIGNAEGVTVKYNGEAFDLEQYREGVYAKFSVNED